MAKKKRLDEYNVQPKETAIVVGKVQYSRFLTKVEGEELNRNNERAIARGQRPATRPFYQLTISDPVVHSTSTPGSEYAQFLNDRVYTSTQTGERRLSFNSTSPFPISQGQYDETGVANVIEFEAELAPGQMVAVVVEIFRNSGGTLSSSFKSVIVPAGPISYYAGSNSLGIAGFGMPFEQPATVTPQHTAPVTPVTPQPVPSFTPPVSNEPVATAAPISPFGATAQTSAPASPFGTTPTNTPPATPFG